METRLVIFDLDGTLLNTLGDLAASLNYALKAAGFPERSIEEVRRFVGNGIGLLVERGCPAGTSPETVERVLASFKEHYARNCAVQTRPYPGIHALLERLRAAELKLAMLSNKTDSAVQILCRQYFPGGFDLAVGEQKGIPRKPDPTGVWDLMARLGASAKETVYIGDSEVDVALARNAGLRLIAVEWGFRTREQLIAAGAEEIVSDAQALGDAILS